MKGLHEYALYSMPSHYLVDYKIAANLSYIQENGKFMYEDELLLNESLGFNKETLVDALQFLAGGAGEVLLPGVPVDTAVDAFVSMETAADTFQSISSIGSIIPSISELFSALKNFDLSAGFGAIYELVHKVLNLIYEMKGEGFLEKMGDALHKILEKISRAISKFIGTLIPYDPGAIAKVVETGLNYISEGNVFENLVKAFNTIVPEDAKDLLFDRKKAIGFFNSIIDAILGLVGKFTGVDLKENALTDMAVDAGKAALGSSLSPIADIAKGAAQAVGQFAPGMFDSVKEYVNSFREKIPSFVDIMRYFLNLLFGIGAAIQVILNKDYEEEEVEFDDQDDFRDALLDYGEEYGEDMLNKYLDSKGLDIDIDTLKNFDVTDSDSIDSLKSVYDKFKNTPKDKSKKSNKKDDKPKLKKSDSSKKPKAKPKPKTKPKAKTSKKKKTNETLKEVMDMSIIKWKVRYR